MKGKTEIGQTFFRTEESSEGLLSRGVNVATLRLAGTEPWQEQNKNNPQGPKFHCLVLFELVLTGVEGQFF